MKAGMQREEIVSCLVTPRRLSNTILNDENSPQKYYINNFHDDILSLKRYIIDYSQYELVD